MAANGVQEVATHVWPLALSMLAAGAIALKRYRQTVD